MMDLKKSYEYFQPDKFKDRIHIIGCGSVGSTIAELLTRSGITKFTLWDFDKVEPHNIANQMFRQTDIGYLKVDALVDILSEINPDVRENAKLKPDGWKGQQLSGYVFLAVDNIELRREIVEKHMNSFDVKAMFDVRTSLEEAQHYAADWTDLTQKENFLGSMQFSHEEAMEASPVSACNTVLSVAPTIRVVCSYAVANFMNFWNRGELKNMIVSNAFKFDVFAV